MAFTLAAAGAHVTLVARRVDRLREIQQTLESDGHRSACHEMDVTDRHSVDAAVRSANKGPFGPVRILVNNAGVSVARPALEQSDEDWSYVMETNLRGPWWVAQAIARAMVQHGVPGSIVNVASILGKGVASTVVPYSMSKAGLIQMTRGLALEWARHGIRVNAMLPGYIATDLNTEFLSSVAGEKLRSRVPLRRFSQASDLNGALLLLASDAGRQITGAELTVDGGHLVSSL
jgi:NAD(P)-dependent dehydrogenase (short-subunit alcohol dehydrogenase family)